MKTKTKTK